MSKRTSDRSTLAEAKITKWFTTKAKNEPQESNEENPEGGAVSEIITKTEEPIPSVSVSKQMTNTSRKS